MNTFVRISVSIFAMLIISHSEIMCDTKVQLTLYYETLCPYSRGFFHANLSILFRIIYLLTSHA